jgi:hypothetical protein
MLPQPQSLAPQSRSLPLVSSPFSADEQLLAFQTHMTPYFPFIVIPKTTTASELQREKPFLYQNIMMVTSHRYVSSQLEQRARIMRDASEHMFVYGRKSLDLLQGLLVFIAWYHHYLGVSPQMSNCIMLATALVFDLGLHKPVGPVEGHDLFIDAMKTFNDRRIKSPRTLEGKRAFLGLFCLSHS